MPDQKQPRSGSPHVYTAAELAASLGGYLDGASAGDRIIRSVAPLDSAGPDDLSWIGSPLYLKLVPASAAGVILAGENDELPQGGVPPQGCTVIRVADPDAAVVEALALLARGSSLEAVQEAGAVVPIRRPRRFARSARVPALLPGVRRSEMRCRRAGTSKRVPD